MPRMVEEVSSCIPIQPKVLRVAAYARVSSGKDAMLHSLSQQVSYYNDLIQNHQGWSYAGVYSDKAVTGTKESRSGFQHLLSDCREGKIDMVITKSISRFARNTVTLLETVRELKSMNIDVFFEEQNIHTLSSSAELMLTILASFAQEESRSVSENQKWRIRKNFEEGKPWKGAMLGYRYHDGCYEIVPEEAAIVLRIYADYLSGKGLVKISKDLESLDIPTYSGNPWHIATIAGILRNYAYTGNLLLQRFFRKNHITKRTLSNNGELPKYHVENSHEPIIPIETFAAVQDEIERRAEKYAAHGSNVRYPFSGLITCANCQKHYRRKCTHAGPVWICSTFNSRGKAACASKQIPESVLLNITKDIDMSEVSKIIAQNGNKLTFLFKNGSEIEKEWRDRSHQDIWTDEMRESARQKTLERIK